MIVAIFLGVLLLIAVGGIIFTVYLYKKESDEDLLDGNIVFNLMSPLSQNRATGIEKSAEMGNGGRYVCKYFPTDVHPDEVGELDYVKVVVGKGCRYVIPINSWSAKKSIVVYLPNKAEYLPDCFKKIANGNIMNVIENISSIETELRAVREGSERKSEIAERMGDGELSQEQMNQFEELTKDMRKSLTDGRKKDFGLSGQGGQ